MKHIISLLLASALVYSASASAGYTTQGSVTVTDSTTHQIMKGYAVVGINTLAGHETAFITASLYDGLVRFVGRDGATNKFFTCSISVGFPQYEHAREVAMNLKIGSYVQVSRPLNSGTCNDVFAANSSIYMTK